MICVHFHPWEHLRAKKRAQLVSFNVFLTEGARDFDKTGFFAHSFSTFTLEREKEKMEKVQNLKKSLPRKRLTGKEQISRKVRKKINLSGKIWRGTELPRSEC